MDAGKKVLLDLFTGLLRFTVPVYQRRYSWGEAQCRQLWTDIVTAGRHPDRTHFHRFGRVDCVSASWRPQYGHYFSAA